MTIRRQKREQKYKMLQAVGYRVKRLFAPLPVVDAKLQILVNMHSHYTGVSVDQVWHRLDEAMSRAQRGKKARLIGKVKEDTLYADEDLKSSPDMYADQLPEDSDIRSADCPESPDQDQPES